MSSPSELVIAIATWSPLFTSMVGAIQTPQKPSVVLETPGSRVVLPFSMFIVKCFTPLSSMVGTSRGGITSVPLTAAADCTVSVPLVKLAKV